VAVYVILEFEDEHQALTLVEDHFHYPEGRLLTPVQENDVECKVVGVFKKPTLFCPGHTGKKTETGYMRGKKWGWWVCSVCGRPTKRWADSLMDSSLGNNLLPDERMSVVRSPFARTEQAWKIDAEV
jgi:hypothetical protein